MCPAALWPAATGAWSRGPGYVAGEQHREEGGGRRDCARGRRSRQKRRTEHGTGETGAARWSGRSRRDGRRTVGWRARPVRGQRRSGARAHTHARVCVRIAVDRCVSVCRAHASRERTRARHSAQRRRRGRGSRAAAGRGHAGDRRCCTSSAQGGRAGGRSGGTRPPVPRPCEPQRRRIRQRAMAVTPPHHGRRPAQRGDSCRLTRRPIANAPRSATAPSIEHVAAVDPDVDADRTVPHGRTHGPAAAATDRPSRIARGARAAAEWWRVRGAPHAATGSCADRSKPRRAALQRRRRSPAPYPARFYEPSQRPAAVHRLPAGEGVVVARSISDTSCRWLLPQCKSQRCHRRLRVRRRCASCRRMACADRVASSS